MRRRLLLFATLLLGTVVVAPVTPSHAQEKEDRVAGTVQLINKDTKTISVTSEAGNTQQQVVYDATTKITKDNKPGSIDDVQNGRRVICLGKNNDKGQLVARRIDVRPAS